MMNGRFSRTLALLLAVVLLLSGCASNKAVPVATPEPSPEVKASAEPELAAEPEVTPEPEPTRDVRLSVSFDPDLSVDDLFRMGNEAYKSMDYKKAEACYLAAIERADASDSHTEKVLFNVRNNLVLTLLQLEKNEEAIELSYELVAGSAPSPADHYGYILNHLVCAHALGRSAVETLAELAGMDWFKRATLEELAAGDPGTYCKLALGIIYNALYIDMEGEVADGIGSLSELPVQQLDASANYENITKTIADAAELGGIGARGALNDMMDREAYLQLIKSILSDIQFQNRIVFDDAEDPDVAALITYVDALIASGQEG